MSEKPDGKEQGRYYGEYIGIVESTDDPSLLMRVQVRVYGVFTAKVPTKDLPWAEYKLPIGARVNDGYFTPVDVGDIVWVDMPYNGDSRRPRITGSVHHTPGKIPNFPHEAFAGTGKLTHKTTGEEPSPAPAQYHKNAVYTQHGVTIEVNEDKSLSITQRQTGTAIRVSPQGDVTIHGEKSIYLSARENGRVIIEGNAKIDVSGDTDITIRGVCNLTAFDKINLDGGGGEMAGVITGKSICPITSLPHSDPSTNVFATKG